MSLKIEHRKTIKQSEDLRIKSKATINEYRRFYSTPIVSMALEYLNLKASPPVEQLQGLKKEAISLLENSGSLSNKSIMQNYFFTVWQARNILQFAAAIHRTHPQLRQALETPQAYTSPILTARSLSRFFYENPDLCASITELDITDSGLLGLPKMIELFNNVKVLILSDNDLSCIPSEIGQLTHLEKLYCRSANLQELPPSIGALKSLKVLDLADNFLGSLPKTIANLSNLEQLILSDNCLEIFKPIDQLFHLKILSLDKNNLTMIPSTISNLQRLELLHLYGNPIENLPIETQMPTSYLTNEISDDLRVRFNRLGKENRWLHFIDGQDVHLGPDVYDLGLHEKEFSEKGYRQSMENAYDFLEAHLNRRFTVGDYLQLHNIACAHFDEEKTNTSSKFSVGKFRGESDCVTLEGFNFYDLDQVNALREKDALEQEIFRSFGASFGLGTIEWIDDKKYEVALKRMSSQQVSMIANKFLTDFYHEAASSTSEQTLLSIAKLIRNLEFLHPFEDGTTRTNMAFMNFLLTQYGFYPTILEDPNVSIHIPLESWANIVLQGLSRSK